MNMQNNRQIRRALTIAVACLFLIQVTAASAGAYALGSTVADMRQAPSLSGGTSCPQLTRFDISTQGTINRQWSTVLGTSPVTILTADQTAAGRLNEIENVIQQSLAVWTGVSGSSLMPAALSTLQRTTVQAACTSSDGLNSICFDQNDAAFVVGVLAFTRVVSAIFRANNSPRARRLRHSSAKFSMRMCSCAPATPPQHSRPLRGWPRTPTRTISNPFSRTNSAIPSASVTPEYGGP